MHHVITNYHKDKYWKNLWLSWETGNTFPNFDIIDKLKKINGYARLTLDKLPTTDADFIRTDNDWQE